MFKERLQKNTSKNKTLIRNSFLLLVLSFLISFSYAAWLENIPSQIIQPDSTIVEVLLSGDEFHNWAHDEDGFTIIKDPVTGYWCWAVAEDGDLVSTGYPIHTTNRNLIGLSPGENISTERYREIRQPFDEELLLNSNRSPKTCEVHNIVIFIKFLGDDDFEEPFEYYEEMFNAPEDEDSISLYQYFYEASYGQLEVISHFFPIQTGNTIISYQSQYPKNHFTNHELLRNDLLIPAIEYIEHLVPLNIIPRSKVDNVSFVIRGKTGNGSGDPFWPHMSLMSNVSIHGKTVDTYNVNIEQALQAKKTGVLAHEYAHSMNFPDLYRDELVNPYMPIGIWDLMAVSDYPPRSISSYLKMKYGEWITIPTISIDSTYTLHPLTTHQTDNAYRINSIYPSVVEYFILEYRKNTTGIIDSTLAGSGILIYRVNEGAGWGNYNGPPDMLYVFRPEGTLMNNGYLNQAFFSADVGRTGFNRSTEPEPFLTNGGSGGINITNIGSAGDTISFTYSETEEYQQDLLASSFSGPEDTLVNQEIFFEFKVINDGTQPVNGNNYSIILMNEAIVLSSVCGVSLDQESIHLFYLPWTPIEYGFYEIHAFINFATDQIQKNNTSQKVTIAVQADFITIDPTGNIQEAIDLCLPGGIVELQSGEYISPKSYSIKDKDISIIGSDNPVNPTILKGRLILENVSNQSMIMNLTFKTSPSFFGWNEYPNHRIINLLNSTPIIDGISILIDEELEFIGIYADFTEGDNYLLQISNTSIYGGQGIFLESRDSINTSLVVANCLFENNFIFSPSYEGAGLKFIGNNLDVSWSDFIIDNTDIVISTEHYSTILITINNNDVDKEISLKNNKFISIWEGYPTNISDIKIQGNSNYDFYLERNIFKTTGISSLILHNRIRLDSSPNSVSFKSSIINNTDLLINPYSQYNFITYSGKAIFHNNLITGQINPIDNIIENEISYNWFLNPQNLDNNQYIVMHNNFLGDPLLNIEEPYQPIWDSENKSLLIHAGHPALYGEIWHEDDLSNNDPTNNRRSIGAVPAIPNSFNKYNLYNSPITPLDNPRNIAWVTFPYLDKLYQGLLDDLYSADAIYYNLHVFNNNNLFSVNDSRILNDFKWKYNGDYEILYDSFLDSWELDENTPILDSRYGYKIQLIPNSQTNIIVSGFLAELYGNDDDSFGTLPMTIEPGLHGDGSYTEIWVGYYKLKSEEPKIALKDIIDELIEIKTQLWSMNRRNVNDNWIVAGTDSPRFNFGEAVSLKYVGNDPVTFTWNVENNNQASEPNIYIHPTPQYFTFEEQLDYTPIYVYLSDAIASLNGEIAMKVDDVIVGAEVINGEILQINAYIEGVDLEDADIEFLVYEYDTRSDEYAIEEEYLVYNQESKIFQLKCLDLQKKDMFHVVSFRDENENNIGDLPTKTLLIGNYPNPFNPSTTIRYSLAQKENVILKIYNIKGQLVKNLVDATQEPGRYTVVWEGDNYQKNQVSSGIYLYRFETNETTQIKKMLLIK